MDTFAAFTASLHDNAALLLVAMPLIGAVLVRLMGRNGNEPVYYTALTNVWVCCGLVVLAVFQLEPRSEFDDLFRPQMLTSLALSEDEGAARLMSDVAPAATDEASPQPAEQSIAAASQRRPLPYPRLSVAINGLNLWLVALTVAAVTAAVRGIDRQRDYLTSRLSWLLLTEAALLGTLVAQDVILLSGCHLLSVFGLFVLIGLSTSPQRHAVAHRFLRTQLSGGVLLSLGLVGAAVSHWWMTLAAEVAAPLSFSLNQIVAQIPDLALTSEAGHAYWRSVLPWLFLLITAGCVLRIALPPLHHWWLQAMEHSDRGTAGLLACGYLPTGLYVVARIVGPLFPERCLELTPRLLTWTLLAAVALALSGWKLATAMRAGSLPPGGLKTDEPLQRRLIGLALAMCLSIGFGAMISTEPLAVRGALLLTVSASAATGLAVWLLPGSPSSDLAGRRSRRLAVVVRWLLLSGLVAVPISGTFWGLLLVAYGFSRHSALLTLLLLLSLVVFSGAVLRGLSDSSRADSDTSPNTATAGLLGMLPLTLVLITTAVAPTLICGPPPPPETDAIEGGQQETTDVADPPLFNAS